MGVARLRLLVFNCHEPWIAQLDGLPYELDILVGLKGRPEGWNARARPLPQGARLVSLDEARLRTYDCVVVHNAADLLEARTLDAPRLLVIHNTLDGRVVEEGAAVEPDAIRVATRRLIDHSGAFAVAVSPMKAASWGVEDGWLRPGIDVEAFGPHVGSLARGLRVANHVHLRQRILRWRFHAIAMRGVPVTLVGENPGIAGAEAARSFQHLKDLYRVHRFYVHTASVDLEDGYNLATLEAMASGLPVLGNRHPSSPVETGVSGVLSDDPAALTAAAHAWLADPEAARRAGEAARETVRQQFPRKVFAVNFARAVQQARERWGSRRNARCA